MSNKRAKTQKRPSLDYMSIVNYWNVEKYAFRTKYNIYIVCVFKLCLLS